MKRERKNIVVFASGRGSNFQALCEAIEKGTLSARVTALVTNICGAGACNVARKFGIPTIEIAHAGLTRLAHEEAVLEKLNSIPCDWVVLAGYMRLFTPDFIGKFWDEKLGAARIVNIHPSLLPAFPGKNGYAQAIRYGVKLTGVTVHLVGSGLDDGPIVDQRALEVLDDDIEYSLSKRGLKLEHELYPEALERLLTERWSVTTGVEEGGRKRVVFENGEK